MCVCGGGGQYVIGDTKMDLQTQNQNSVRVQKHIFVSKRGILRELLKRRTNVRSRKELLLLCVRGSCNKIPLTRSRAQLNQN